MRISTYTFCCKRNAHSHNGNVGKVVLLKEAYTDDLKGFNDPEEEGIH